jgi:uncharacterized protein YndB with AHSA1/START domain
MATRQKGAGANGKINGIGDDALREKTGRTWTEWVEILDEEGARTMAHADIASLLHEKFRVAAWWTQMVTVGYEQMTGRRVKGQKADGFAVSASKTLPVSPDTAFKAFNDTRARSKWLRDEITIRKATAPKSLRITWRDGKTHLDVDIYAKGSGKTQVSLQHSKLANAREAARMKKYWAEALGRLEDALIA